MVINNLDTKEQDQPTPGSLCSSGGGALTDPRSIGRELQHSYLGSNLLFPPITPIDQGSASSEDDARSVV